MRRVDSAADRAAAEVAEVRDDPDRRRALASDTYSGHTGEAPRHLPFRRAHLAFVDWQLRRGVLNPPGHVQPGSPWWRAVNERLLRDGRETIARLAGQSGPISSRAVEFWLEFADNPTPSTWYRAHNASIVAGYLEHAELAGGENESERFFLNVVLLRVLYAHAMVAAPRLALGPLHRVAPVLGDPRVRMTGLFLRLGHTLPDRYPFEIDVSTSLARENVMARAIDYGVIGPRLQPLYDWSAQVLGEPALRKLIADGSPCYALELPREIWHPTSLSFTERLVRGALPAQSANRPHRRKGRV